MPRNLREELEHEYDNQKMYLLEEFLRDLKRLEEQKVFFEEIMPYLNEHIVSREDEFGNANYYVGTTVWGTMLTFPWKKETITLVQNIISKIVIDHPDWELGIDPKEDIDTSTEVAFEFTKNMDLHGISPAFKINFNAHLRGSTCIIEKTEEKVEKVVAHYKIICN